MSVTGVVSSNSWGLEMARGLGSTLVSWALTGAYTRVCGLGCVEAMGLLVRWCRLNFVRGSIRGAFDSLAVGIESCP